MAAKHQVLNHQKLQRLNLAKILHLVGNCIVEALDQALDVTLPPGPGCAWLMTNPK